MLNLTNLSISDTRSYHATDTIAAGSSVSLNGSADVTFDAPTVVLGNGFSVASLATLKVPGTP